MHYNCLESCGLCKVKDDDSQSCDDSEGGGGEDGNGGAGGYDESGGGKNESRGGENEGGGESGEDESGVSNGARTLHSRTDASFYLFFLLCYTASITDFRSHHKYL